LAAELGKIQGAIITDYRGMSVEEITRLRRRLRTVGARYQIVKNTLLKIAMTEQHLPDISGMLEGPSAVLFAEGDPVEAAKILATFIKELRKELPGVKGGLLGDTILNPADVANLATLPSRDQILGNLVGTIQAPVANVVAIMSAVMQNLVGTVEAYHDKMSGGSDASEITENAA
jgi:large subunit ribosomal protein L10